MRIVRAALLIVLLIAVAIFCLQNLGTVSVAYLGWNVDLPIPVLVVVVYVAGTLTGWGLLAFIRGTIRRVADPEE